MSDSASRDQGATAGSGGANDPSSTTSSVSTAKRPSGDPAGRGRTTIADGVVEKIAGLAARDVIGVHAMGSGASRTFGAMRERVPGTGGKSVSRGVKAEVGEVQTALDLEIVVDYGVAIADVAREVREDVIAAVERMTGLQVVEVNIAVSDVKLPDEDDDDQDGRVQ